MEMLTIIIGSWLTYTMAIKPIVVAAQKKKHQKFWRFYRHHQLRQVQSHYPELHGLTLNEIRSKYNVSDAYNRLS